MQKSKQNIIKLANANGGGGAYCQFVDISANLSSVGVAYPCRLTFDVIEKVAN